MMPLTLVMLVTLRGGKRMGTNKTRNLGGDHAARRRLPRLPPPGARMAWLSSHSEDEWIDWATDAQLARDRSKYWMRTGIASIVFMLVVTWTGWWYQRY